ncbi:MAG TPA: glycosyltransferase family 2 protein, partial [Longimicrobiales bacterium]|nr:glycosyltransferase family 2 protein [Longimicrobiales bacterium]
MTLPLLLALPWLGLLVFLVRVVRLPRELPPGPPARTPSVSVIVPARNEAVNIETLLGSVTASRYPDFEIVVVDDRSDDGTGALARAHPRGNAKGITVVDGAELPEGWLGKPWACRQGAQAATGDLLLFTDADTVHGPDLLERAVAAMEDDEADVVTVAGRQLMGSFWERLVQPQVFLTMVFRFYDAEKTVRSGRWRDAIANGQFLMFKRATYQAIGGHESVKDEVVEDQMLAQRVMRDGHRLSLRLAETAFATRMYRSLGELVAGWSKNIFIAGLHTVPPRLRPFVAPVSVLVGGGLWLAPPVALLLSLAGVGGGGLLWWSGTAVALSAVFWMLFTVRMGAPFYYGLLYPLGAAVGMHIFLRSWRRGRNVEWKGRAYVVKNVAEV